MRESAGKIKNAKSSPAAVPEKIDSNTHHGLIPPPFKVTAHPVLQKRQDTGPASSADAQDSGQIQVPDLDRTPAYAPPPNAQYQWQNEKLREQVFPDRNLNLGNFLKYAKELEIREFLDSGSPELSKYKADLLAEIKEDAERKIKRRDQLKEEIKILQGKSKELAKIVTPIEKGKFNDPELKKVYSAEQIEKIKDLHKEREKLKSDLEKARGEVVKDSSIGYYEKRIITKRQELAKITSPTARAKKEEEVAKEEKLRDKLIESKKNQEERIKKYEEDLMTCDNQYAEAVGSPMKEYLKVKEDLKKFEEEQKSLESVKPVRTNTVSNDMIIARELGKLSEELKDMDHDNLVSRIKQIFGKDPDYKLYPAWLRLAVIHLSGMRYFSSSGSGSSHYSWYSPKALIGILKEEEIDSSTVKKDEKEAQNKEFKERIKSMSEYEAMGLLIAIKETVPDWVWHQIVSKTQLKNNPEFYRENWETNYKQHEGYRKASQEVKSQWEAILKKWADMQAWREENLFGQNPEFVTINIVCNEVGEHIQRFRGLDLTEGWGFGITNKVKWYLKNKDDTTNHDKMSLWQQITETLSSIAGKEKKVFLRPKSETDFQPGASIFFMDFQGGEPDQHVEEGLSRKTMGPSDKYTFPPDDPSRWDLEKLKTSKVDFEATKPKNKEGLVSPVPGLDIQIPGAGKSFQSDQVYEHNGWVYRKGPDGFIVRMKNIWETFGIGSPSDLGISAKVKIEWLRWYHEATVIKVLGQKVWTFETGFRESNPGTGVKSNRTLGSLKDKWNIFVGYHEKKAEDRQLAEKGLEGV